MPDPSFLLVELASEHAGQVSILEGVAQALRAAGVEILACAHAGRVACLEPGTVGAGIVIARSDDPARLRTAAQDGVLPLLRRALPDCAVPLVLQVDGLPVEGLPGMMDVPTVASVPVAPRVPRNALMLIRGSASDPARMDGYRDVILPMIKERGGYYEVFALQPGAVVAWSGAWTEQIFAISRWPQRSAAEDFWYSDRYQSVAIPKRLGAGRFAVHLLDAAD